ncbi:hypothetical protein [Aquimarina algicola]|uniref:DUF3575 domain-containing protein n=1 Tax=Aquimarina algicola TaxID=2589995 RepID=A0A504J9M1_9FLAO|nr:hypothetical protein [Aquimarina algicola]TPN83360.1 hypothetical protein FHK87_19250 [Aquimarina algicola]
MIHLQTLVICFSFFTCFSIVAQEETIWERKKIKPNLETNYDSNWINLLTYKKSFSKYRESWSIQYTGFEDIDNDLIIPFTLSYGQNKIENKILNERGYKSVDIFALGFGLSGYLKMFQGLYIGLGAEVSPGIESTVRINQAKNSHFYIGADFKQGIKIIPWSEFGIVIGIESFQKIQNSKIYTSEIGWAFEVGINF